MRATILFSTLIAAGAAAASCTGYDPDLGSTPFKCNDTEPKCPEDYTCQITGTEAICVGEGGGGSNMTGTDANTSGFQCSPADGPPIEPNDMIANAYTTDAGMVMRTFGPLAICPAGDKDTFKITFASGSSNGIEVIVTWDSGMPVTMSILGSGGNPLMSGVAAGENAIRACVDRLPMGTYFAQVAAAATVQNNYRIQLKPVASCASP